MKIIKISPISKDKNFLTYRNHKKLKNIEIIFRNINKNILKSIQIFIFSTPFSYKSTWKSIFYTLKSFLYLFKSYQYKSLKHSNSDHTLIFACNMLFSNLILIHPYQKRIIKYPI